MMFHPSYKRNLGLLGGAEFFGFFGITALWLLFLSQEGMSLWQIGLLESIFHTTSFLSEVPSGVLADRFSYKANLYLSRVMMILSSFLMLQGQGNFWIYALAMMVMAWSYNFDSGTSLAFLYESAVEAGLKDRYLFYNSLFSGLSEATRALGLVAAAFFVQGLMPWTYRIQIVLSFLSILFIALTKETEVKEESEKQVGIKEILRMVGLTFESNPNLLSWLVASQFFLTVMAMFYFYYQNQLTDLSTLQISLVMLLSSAMNIVAVWFANKVGKKWSATFLFPILLAVVGILYLLSGLGTSFIYMFVFILSEAFFAFFQPIFYDQLQVKLDNKVRASMLSVTAMFFSLSMVLIFPLVGWSIEGLGFSQTFFLLGVVLCLASLYFLIFRREKK